VRVGLVKREKTDRYRTHRLLHEYAITLAEECDARYLRVWRQRFGEYYLNVTQGVFAMWQQGEEAEALKMWPRQIRHIERGYEYAADQGRGDRVLEYLRCTAFYLGLSGREATVRHWLDRFGSLPWSQVQGASGNMYLGEAFLLLGEAGQSVSLLRMARSVWSEVGEDRLWLHTTILLAQAMMVAGQRETALALTYEESYARIVESLPAGDPLRAEVWTFSGDVRWAMGRYPDA
jgi:hypothetical protein